MHSFDFELYVVLARLIHEGGGEFDTERRRVRSNAEVVCCFGFGTVACIVDGEGRRTRMQTQHKIVASVGDNSAKIRVQDDGMGVARLSMRVDAYEH